MATIYQEAMQYKFLSTLEEDVDDLLLTGEVEATTCQEATTFNDCDSNFDDAWPFIGTCQGLIIRSTPQGRFVYWKSMKPSQLLQAGDRLVAHLDTLPFHEGRPLASVTPGATALVDYSSDKHTSHRHVYMAEVEGNANRHPNEQLDQISKDKITANGGSKMMSSMTSNAIWMQNSVL